VVPNVSLSNASGPVGVEVGINGQGFVPGETVNLFWNYTGPGTGTQEGSAVAGYSGSIKSQFAVPYATNGSYAVAAIGATSNTIVQQAFTIANGLAASPSSDGPGQIIAVNGTGFQGSESVQFYWDTTNSAPIATVNAGSAGNVHTTFAIATSLAPGVHTLTGVGMTSGLTFNISETINTNWGDFGYDYAHHRENPQENTLSKSNVANLQLKWTATTATGLKASPVYSNGLVFLPTMDGFLNAYNATTGALQWQFNCKCSFRNYSSALADPVNNMVFFGTVGAADEGIPSPFYAVNAQTGVLEWSVILNWHEVSFPTLALNTIYVGTYHLDHTNSAIYAIDEVSGHIKWQYLANSGFWGAVGVDPNTNAAFTGVGNPGDAIMSLNALTGAVNWQTVVPNFTADDDVGSGITVSNGFVYASGKNGYVYELNESTGAIVWSTLVGSPGIGNISTQALSAAGVLYVGSLDHKLYALSASTGAILWRVRTNANILSSPAIANGVVYFASFDHNIYAVNANTGKVLWSYKLGNSSDSSPVLVNGWLYCGASDGKLYAFSL
jgi:outer membrane protein assembly factor BamB